MLPTGTASSARGPAHGTDAFRVVFLVGADRGPTRSAIEEICRLEGVTPVAVLVDTHRPGIGRRLKRLRRNIGREGVGYLWWRAIRMLRDRLERLAARVVPAGEVETLLRRAFPERCFSLKDLARKYGFELIDAGNLNGDKAVQYLRDCRATLGVALGTRVLKRTTFGIPAQGCVNLHKGKMPEFRGMPPGFWELYEGVDCAGVTVHFVDDGLDTGDILGEAEVPIHPKETPDSLRTKLDSEGIRLLADCIARLRDGTASPRPQPPSDRKARTKPTRGEELQLAARAPHWRRAPGDLRMILRTGLYLTFFYSGVYGLLRRRARRPHGRATIVLYHRVNDISQDTLTTSTRVFAEHLVILRRYYNVISTAQLVEKVRSRQYLPPTTVGVHFDDCYRDVFTEAGPLLHAAGLPSTMFISSGFIGTDRVFEHDAEKYPYRFENLRSDDIPRLLDRGFEIGAHTVNHVNLGVASLEEATIEVLESKRQLEVLAGGSVALFSFPFGRREHLQPAVRAVIENAGFQALFSAYGGCLSAQSDPFDIPRTGISHEYRGIDLMMEIEGLTVAVLLRRLRGRR